MTTESEFRAGLAADGSDGAGGKTIGPGAPTERHGHPHDARPCVAAGSLALGAGSREVASGPGGHGEVPRGQRHFERHGAGGARIVAGRRHA